MRVHIDIAGVTIYLIGEWLLLIASAFPASMGYVFIR
jgi:hypothetical protein